MEKCPNGLNLVNKINIMLSSILINDTFVRNRLFEFYGKIPTSYSRDKKAWQIETPT